MAESKFQSVKQLDALKPRTTVTGSSKIRNWSEEIKKTALFSARTTRKTYLEEIKKKLKEIASREVVPQLAVHHLKTTLAGMGYTPHGGFPGDLSAWHGAKIPPAKPGSITDLSSQRRINLIIDTNIKQAQSMGQISTSDNPVFLLANPAWELTRVGSRKRPRKDWLDRWKKAGESVGWKGALKGSFAALKDSPIWQALGEGVGGYKDTLGSDYPPYAFGSGMGWVNVGRREWKSRCEKEGVPDQLESIVEKAKALKRAQEAVGGKGSYGASAVSRWNREEAEERALRPAPVQKPIFHPDVSALVPVREDIGKVRESIKALQEKLFKAGEAGERTKDYIDSVRDKYIEVAWGTSVLTKEFDDFGYKLNGYKAEAQGLEGEAVGLLSAADAIPVPTDEDGQARFAMDVSELKEKAESLRGRMGVAEKFAKEAGDVLDQLRAMADAEVVKWKSEECGKIEAEVRESVEKMDKDEFETIKDEFKELKRQLKVRS